jgi:hypothetical protein
LGALGILGQGKKQDGEEEDVEEVYEKHEAEESDVEELAVGCGQHRHKFLCRCRHIRVVWLVF